MPAIDRWLQLNNGQRIGILHVLTALLWVILMSPSIKYGSCKISVKTVETFQLVVYQSRSYTSLGNKLNVLTLGKSSPRVFFTDSHVSLENSGPGERESVNTTVNISWAATLAAVYITSQIWGFHPIIMLGWSLGISLLQATSFLNPYHCL